MLILAPTLFSLTPAPGPTAVLDWSQSGNGQQVTEHGQCAASLLPRDDEVVLVLPPRALSWHRVNLPKVGSGRLRAVLDGLLEDRLLSDTAELHYALEPGGTPGRTVWVAACHKAWLQGWLAALEAAGRPVSRIVPAIAPLPEAADGQPVESLHWAHAQADRAWLASASAQGVSCTPLPGEAGLGDAHGFGDPALTPLGAAPAAAPAGAAALHPVPEGASARWLADPAVATQAEQTLHQRVELEPLAQWLLRCGQSGWNLAQFDLSLSAGARRGQRLRQTLRQWRSAPAWRPARWGLAALLVVQLLGLNASAWHESRVLDAKQQAVRQTLQQAFPQVTLVLDAPVQMQRELGRLQQASGALAAGDLETMLAALAQAAPAEAAAGPSSIEFAPAEGRFGAWQAPEAPLRTLQQSLERAGWQTRFDGGQLTLRPADR